MKQVEIWACIKRGSCQQFSKFSFNISSPGLNHEFKSLTEIVTHIMQGFMGYFEPCFLQRTFQSTHRLIRWNTGISLQNGPNRIIYEVQVWWRGWSKLLAPETWKNGLSQLLCFFLTCVTGLLLAGMWMACLWNAF